MKYFFLLLLFLFTPVTLFLFTQFSFAQHVEVASTGKSSENDVHTFSFDHSFLQIHGNRLTVTGKGDRVEIRRAISYDLSAGGKFLSAIHYDGSLRATLIDGRGYKVGDFKLDYIDRDDETLKIRVFDDGHFVTRDNVANFSFFDARGSLLYSVSNRSGSPDGEVASEMAADPSGNTVLLYNPIINYGTAQGSQARLFLGENDFIELYSSRSRTIKYVDITKNGSYLALVSVEEDADDEVVVSDRFGNYIATLATDENLRGVTLSEDAETVTIFSDNRVQVYRLADMEQLGSASFSVRVNYATYSEQDRQILALCGRADSQNRLANPEIHVVHLEKRSISSTEIDFPLAIRTDHSLMVDRTGPDQFTMSGLTRELTIRTRF